MDSTYIISIILIGLMWLCSIINALKPILMIHSKKPYLGDKRYEFFVIGNYSWIIYIPLAYLYLMTWNTMKSSRFTSTFPEYRYFFEVSLFVVAFLTTFYTFFQKRSIWSGGIMDPTYGVFLWEDIVSYSLAKPNPSEIDTQFFWRPGKYLLKFYYVKKSKLIGVDIKEISWRVKESMAGNIGAFLQEKISHHENAPVDNN